MDGAKALLAGVPLDPAKIPVDADINVNAELKEPLDPVPLGHQGSSPRIEFTTPSAHVQATATPTHPPVIRASRLTTNEDRCVERTIPERSRREAAHRVLKCSTSARFSAGESVVPYV